MKTNNEQGRNIALIVGVYFILKAVLNLILGGGILDVITSAIEAALLYTGLMYVNYVIAVIVAIVFLKHIGKNIINIGQNLIYLLEGIVDLICAVVICLSGNVREHFTNKLSDIFNGNEK